MAEETQAAPAAEEAKQTQTEKPDETERQVPLAALEAERAKRQEMEAKMRMYEEHIARGQQQAPKQQDNDDDIVTVKDLKILKNSWKREAVEEAFCAANPDAVAEVEKALPTVLQQKPWLKNAIESAPNRWQAAHDIVRTLAPSEPKRTSVAEENAKKLEKNLQKPGSSSSAGTAPQSRMDLVNSMVGTPAFSEWSKKVMRGEIKF